VVILTSFPAEEMRLKKISFQNNKNYMLILLKKALKRAIVNRTLPSNH